MPETDGSSRAVTATLSTRPEKRRSPAPGRPTSPAALGGDRRRGDREIVGDDLLHRETTMRSRGGVRETSARAGAFSSDSEFKLVDNMNSAWHRRVRAAGRRRRRPTAMHRDPDVRQLVERVPGPFRPWFDRPGDTDVHPGSTTAWNLLRQSALAAPDERQQRDVCRHTDRQRTDPKGRLATLRPRRELRVKAGENAPRTPSAVAGSSHQDRPGGSESSAIRAGAAHSCRCLSRFAKRSDSSSRQLHSTIRGTARI